MVRYLVIFYCILLFSCSQDEEVEPNGITINGAYPNVEEELWEFFEAFEVAGNDRGWDIDLRTSEITGVIANIEEEGVAGSCSYGHRLNPKEIIIDSDFWNQASPDYREYIIFHELGHCYLFRDHEDICLSTGIWSSIMRSGTILNCRDQYNSRTKAYYLDELFSINM